MRALSDAAPRATPRAADMLHRVIGPITARLCFGARWIRFLLQLDSPPSLSSAANPLHRRRSSIPSSLTSIATTHRSHRPCRPDYSCCEEQRYQSRHSHPPNPSRPSCTLSSTSSAPLPFSPLCPTTRAPTTKRFGAVEVQPVEREKRLDAVTRVRDSTERCLQASMEDRRRMRWWPESVDSRTCTFESKASIQRMNANETRAAFRWICPKST